MPVAPALWVNQSYEAKELRELHEQNARLKQLLGQAELEKAALRELVERNFEARRTGTKL